MHGRKLKTETDDKENKEKAKKLIAMINMLTEKKIQKIYDKTGFEIADAIVKKFPFIQTVWNYRREYFESIKIDNETNENGVVATSVNESTSEVIMAEEKKDNIIYDNNKMTIAELKKQIKNENDMVEFLIAKHQKSYELWLHKLWLMKFSLKNKIINSYALYKELDFCKKCFLYDDRNFHCWNYRAYILSCLRICLNACIDKNAEENKNSEIEAIEKETYSIEKETKRVPLDKIHNEENHTILNNKEEKKIIDFDVFHENYQLSKQMIENNFSNFSAWFLKQSLHESFINITEELELIKNAIFTDPYDQSLWQFYNWFLFHRGNAEEQIWLTFLKEKKIYFFFSNLVELNISKCKCCDENDKEIKGSWERQAITFSDNNKNLESFVFTFQIDKNINLEKIKSVKCVFYYWKYNIYYPNIVNYEKNILQDLRKEYESAFVENNHQYLIHHEINFKDVSQNENFELQIFLKKNNFVSEMVYSASNLYDCYPLYEYIKYSKRIWSWGKGVDSNVLQLELEQIDELLSLENVCKFALLSKFTILKELEKYKEAFEVLELIKKTDTNRKEYYKEIERELQINQKIHEYYLTVNEPGNSFLDLSNMQIQDITYPLLIEAFFIPQINLENNYLSESYVGKCSLNFLYNLKELNLRNNRIEQFSLFMKNIYNLKLLEILDVSENTLVSLNENLEKYEFVLLPSLREITISNSNLSFLLQDKFLKITELNGFKVIRENDSTRLLKLIE